MYAYTKSEWGSQPKEESDLFSGWIGPNPKQCLTFWYHMYGEQINTLKVFQMDSESTIELWNKSANQGNKWYFQSLSLNDIGPYRIKFKAIRGNGSKIEIAIDDISITNTDCKKVSSLDCNFEKETCKWNVEQESEYMWTVISGGTHHDDTGPVVDHTYGFYEGNYIYLNASNIEPGQKSNFTSVTVSSEGDSCFTFWFYMYGDGMGTLNVYLVSETMTQKLWSRSGNKPDLWQIAYVDISMLDPYQMTLEGVRGSTKKGDIAVDDISLLPGSCNKRAFFLDCNFEAEKCNWLPDSETPYIWTSTAAVDNGLDHDHTIGTVNGHYMYFDGLDIPEGMKSKLSSTIINPDGDICFTFWYHMNREEIGTLSVYTESRNTIQMHWSQSGKKSTWTFANFTISKSEPFRIIFEGVRGIGFWGGIGLDDISLIESSCSGLIKTSQKCHKIDESISLRECSKYYLQLHDTSLVFDREFDNCSTVYQDVQTSITTVCNDMKNSNICTFYLPELIMEDQRCFQSNWLSIEYKCEASETTIVSSETSSSDSSSADHNPYTHNLTDIGCEVTIDEEIIDVNKNNAWMEGRRVVELDVMAREMYCCRCNLPLHLSNTVVWFGKCITYKCDNSACLATTDVHTGKRTPNGSYCINSKVAIGMTHAGMGPSHVNNFLTECNLPPISDTTLRKKEKEFSKTIHDIALTSCREAQHQEILLSHGKVAASFDGGWQKRGSGWNYNSNTVIHADNDAATTSKLKVDFEDLEKRDDQNHLKKGLSKSLHQMSVKYKELKQDDTREYILRCFMSLPGGNPLTNESLKEELLVLVSKYTSRSNAISELGSTQANESFNQMASSKAPKSRHYGGSCSLKNRLSAAVLQKNEGYSYLPKVNEASNLSPGSESRVFDLETTGLGRNCEITQIAAKVGENVFQKYVIPRVDIQIEASRVTGITYSQSTNIMYVHGENVEPISIQKALLDFLEFLSVLEKPILIGHNICNFDIPILVRKLKESNLYTTYCKLVKGFVDTLKLAQDDTTVTTVSSVIISREDAITVYAVVVSTLVVIIFAASVFTVIVCHFKKRSKSSKLFDIRQNTTVTERIDSSDYNIINYNEMTGISVLEIKKNRHDINTTHRHPQDIKTSIEQEDNICNKYESLSNNRNSVEHTYESDSIHTNQYESLTKQRELDKHTYGSTENALPQGIKTSIEQENIIYNKYESLSSNRNSVEHTYESDSIHTNLYESLTKQRELDKHTYEST
ncbi:unnamed protein product [Mytilus coruscus]|uniref:MAM domain-containing protein n=1 Tax=Mytilus coruscus TaxID=42192 RepID=A0A6J8CS95_MYTCO|nr:unnamed protein product [Mytilus coruscus]